MMCEVHSLFSSQIAGAVQPILQALDISLLSGAETQHSVRSLGELVCVLLVVKMDLWIYFYHNQRDRIQYPIRERFAPNFYHIGFFREKGEKSLRDPLVQASARAQTAGPALAGGVGLEAC
jgi:hypothetical protein